MNSILRLQEVDEIEGAVDVNGDVGLGERQALTSSSGIGNQDTSLRIRFPSRSCTSLCSFSADWRSFSSRAISPSKSSQLIPLLKKSCFCFSYFMDTSKIDSYDCVATA